MIERSAANPCSQEEWDLLTELACAMEQAVERGDADAMRDASHSMADWIAVLQAKYGDHPLLLETLDAEDDDPRERCRLYGEAIERALAMGEPTLSIRLALVAVLLDDLADPALALAALDACAPELGGEAADAYDRQDHAALRARCQLPAAARPKPRGA